MTTIAVIEDDPVVRENIVERLEAEGYAVVSAENGLKGIDIIREHKPDLVICDIMMPELGGFGVLDFVRKEPEWKLTPFIFLTALADKADVRLGMTFGADDYLTKPFTKDELLNAIAARLDKQHSLASNVESKLDELRDNVSRSLPHELLTPMQTILGYSELIVELYDKLSDEDILQMMRGIVGASQRLLRQIQNHIHYAELRFIAPDDANTSTVREGVIHEPQAIIEETAWRIAGNYHRESDLSMECIRASVQVSETDFMKIALELLDNACKFSSPGTPVIVRTELLSDRYVLTVEDKGRGMTREQINQIGAYVQFDRSRHEQQGAGLGLSLVKRLAEMYDGSFSIDSELDVFTRATVRLRLA